MKFVQILHPLTQRYVKLDATTGRVVCVKRTSGPFANIPQIAARR